MVKFCESAAGAAFVATAGARETSVEIMRAIASLSRNATEAQRIWEGDLPRESTLRAIWERATNSGSIDARDLHWGAAGNRWANIG